jgi:hypothetical protein
LRLGDRYGIYANRIIECRLHEPTVASGRLYFSDHRSGPCPVGPHFEALTKRGATRDDTSPAFHGRQLAGVGPVESLPRRSPNFISDSANAPKQVFRQGLLHRVSRSFFVHHPPLIRNAHCAFNDAKKR